MEQPFLFRKVAVLGAGVMGAQIAAHLANANVEVILFDLPAKEGDKNGIALKAIAGLQKLEPTPFSVKSKATDIAVANYETDLAKLKDCDLIIEAISERIDWKADLYKKVGPHISSQAIFATNTSGLSLKSLSEHLPAHLKSKFCGVHFFNPPRYMALVEIIPGPNTEAGAMNHLESFLTTTLGKSVVRAKDTPNFIANRIGVFSMLATLHHAEKFKLGCDEVDALTGPGIGRAKSATYRTADVVGLDTFAHVVKTMSDTLPDDPWRAIFTLPDWLKTLIEKGAHGQKTGAGVYKKVGKDIMVFDPQKGDYRASGGVVAAEVEAVLKLKNPAERIAKLRECKHPQAQFLWSIFRDLFHYCAVQAESICHNLRDLDFAVRWGFGWAAGPFETWQVSGWQQVGKCIQEDIAAGLTIAKAPLPAWCTETSRTGVHSNEGSWSPAQKAMAPRPKTALHARQLFPERLIGESVEYGKTLWENDGVRVWSTGDDIGIMSFKSKMHAIGQEVLEGVIQGVAYAETHLRGLVVWQTEPPFSAGANLAQVSEMLSKKDFSSAEAMVKRFQDASQALKYSMVPTVAAVSGLALGGGCEFVMHSSRAVVALETYMGLVEAGVGLIPAGGGCKELAIRAAQSARGGNIFHFVKQAFETIAMAQVSRSGEHARELGLLRPTDMVVFNPNELLYIAKQQARALSESGYRPPLRPREIQVVGKGGIATLKMIIANMLAGGFISEHDAAIAERTATVLCGGYVDGGTTVNEDWLLELERSLFVELLKTEKTLARIDYMLKNGKPLRN
ncbi:MAG: 3-hydroxyacyl-CoA dehydrogenase/enoyl-CoA hydratase family protein [Betaproteobacteria bacterium]|nr:3-hydroxyacyl-CoA dehydrogenase/enoyl-CoA hydratase family protein [Betaproteobacteria bacterium]